MFSQGVGARLVRKEDDRLMRGRGQFVADIRLAGMKDVAFLRSPLAHARLRNISIAPENRGVTFTAAELVGVKPIRAVSGLRGFKVSEQPPLATGKVRHVGELVAMCVGATRAEAEDLAQSVTLDLEELPAVYDMLEARKTGVALVHDHWADNVFLETFVDIGISKALDAPIKVAREIRTSRQCMAPIEGRGVVAFWDTRLEQLTLYSACQMPHIVRTGLSECLGLDEGQVRIIAPDVGGGFRLQGHPAAGGDLPRLARQALRLSGALDRGSPRASDCGCQLPRASLPHQRLCRPRRPFARYRLRSRGRFRRLLVLSVLRLFGSRTGGKHPAGAVRFSCLQVSHLLGRHQQVPDPAVSRGGAHRRVFRSRTHARRRGARGRHGAARNAEKKSRSARADAV